MTAAELEAGIDPVRECEAVDLQMTLKYPTVWALYKRGYYTGTAQPGSSGNGNGKPERMLDADEVGERLGIPRKQVLSMIRRGQLPGAHVGRRVRMSEILLNRWIAAKEVKRK